MSAIGSISDLVRVIQTQLAQRPAALGEKRAQARTAGARQGQPEQLAALIELRVRQLDRDDPQRGRKAFRLFLETVLLAQFGEQLLNDPKFYLLVDDVHAAMERDERLKVMIENAADHLLAKT